MNESKPKKEPMVTMTVTRKDGTKEISHPRLSDLNLPTMQVRNVNAGNQVQTTKETQPINADGIRIINDSKAAAEVAQCKKDGTLSPEKMQEILKKYIIAPFLPPIIPVSDMTEEQALYRRWVIAVCNLGAGQFESLNGQALQDVAILATISPNKRGFPSWLELIKQM